MTNRDDICHDYVVARLVEAAQTMMAMPGRVGPASLGAQSYGYVAQAIEGTAVKGSMGRVKLPSPTRDAIARMDEAMAWLALIDRSVIRKVVAARSLVNPITDRHMLSLREIATAVGASHTAIMGWHVQGIMCIVKALLS